MIVSYEEKNKCEQGFTQEENHKEPVCKLGRNWQQDERLPSASVRHTPLTMATDYNSSRLDQQQ